MPPYGETEQKAALDSTRRPARRADVTDSLLHMEERRPSWQWVRVQERDDAEGRKLGPVQEKRQRVRIGSAETAVQQESKSKMKCFCPTSQTDSGKAEGRICGKVPPLR